MRHQMRQVKQMRQAIIGLVRLQRNKRKERENQRRQTSIYRNHNGGQHGSKHIQGRGGDDRVMCASTWRWRGRRRSARVSGITDAMSGFWLNFSFESRTHTLWNPPPLFAYSCRRIWGDSEIVDRGKCTVDTCREYDLGPARRMAAAGRN